MSQKRLTINNAIYVQIILVSLWKLRSRITHVVGMILHCKIPFYFSLGCLNNAKNKLDLVSFLVCIIGIMFPFITLLLFVHACTGYYNIFISNSFLKQNDGTLEDLNKRFNSEAVPQTCKFDNNSLCFNYYYYSFTFPLH